MIKDVRIKKLKIIHDSRGRLMEILRSDDKIFQKFGQVYFTTAKPGIVKAWHYHKKQDDHFVCLQGKVKVVLYDARKKSSTYGNVEEYIMSLVRPFLLKIPRGIYHGFKGLSSTESMILNIPTRPYNRKKPDEYRIDAFNNNIDYDWGK